MMLSLEKHWKMRDRSNLENQDLVPEINLSQIIKKITEGLLDPVTAQSRSVP